MILPCRHTYVPYAQAASAPNIVIDGTPNDNTVLPLSHWPRSCLLYTSPSPRDS